MRRPNSKTVDFACLKDIDPKKLSRNPPKHEILNRQYYKALQPYQISVIASGQIDDCYFSEKSGTFHVTNFPCECCFSPQTYDGNYDEGLTVSAELGGGEKANIRCESFFMRVINEPITVSFSFWHPGPSKVIIQKTLASYFEFSDDVCAVIAGFANPEIASISIEIVE